jgi:hypothetical protein
LDRAGLRHVRLDALRGHCGLDRDLHAG